MKLRNIQRGKLFVPMLDTDVSYICLLQFRRRLDKVWETVDELRPYLRSRFIQLKSKSYKATCSERPPETFLKETMCRLFLSPLLRDVLLFLKFFIPRKKKRSVNDIYLVFNLSSVHSKMEKRKKFIIILRNES